MEKDSVFNMAAVKVLVPVGEGRRIILELPEFITEVEQKNFLLERLGLSTAQIIKTGSSSGIDFAVFPGNIKGAIDEELLMDEYSFLKHQFPLVKMVNLTTYEGMVRCEGGPIYELSEDGVWPFEQYTQWHKYRIKLAYLHPFKPPKVTWLTDIDHPNIIPKRTGKVCVSLLGKGWLPQTKLAAIINALHFLLFDPNPYSHYPNKRCKRAAEVCKQYGFPKKRGGSLLRHELSITCPNCRKPFIMEDPDETVVQCIHCRVLLKRKKPGELEVQ